MPPTRWVFDRHPSLIITNFRQKGKDSMIKTNEIKQKDALLEEITDYVLNKEVTSAEAFSTARYVLLDTLGCGILALQYPECTKLLGTSCTRNNRAKRYTCTRNFLCT